MVLWLCMCGLLPEAEAKRSRSCRAHSQYLQLHACACKKLFAPPTEWVTPVHAAMNAAHCPLAWLLTPLPACGHDVMHVHADGSYQQPILCLVGNLSASGNGRDATRLLLTWREFRTLLHEMGHAVHSLVSRTRFQHVWGTR